MKKTNEYQVKGITYIIASSDGSQLSKNYGKLKAGEVHKSVGNIIVGQVKDNKPSKTTDP